MTTNEGLALVVYVKPFMGLTLTVPICKLRFCTQQCSNLSRCHS